VITIEDKTENFTINGGVIEMKQNKIIVLAD
jgi:F0F1-type ATP synthase epsilon subunit